MKRTALALTLISALLISAVAGAMFANLATANPGPLLFFPTDPVTTPPAIVVHSPVQNRTYNSTDVWLNFTITKPETWFAFNVGSYENGTSISLTFGNITSVYYIVDDGERQNITVHDTAYFLDVSPTQTLNFSTKLTLTEGAHNVKVSLEADCYYVVSYYGSEPFSSVEVHGDSEPVNFTVYQEPFPTTLVSVASVASVTVVCAGLLLLYLKKRNAKSSA
jgi:hypothetical protein